MDLNQIANVFTPSHVITEPNRFAGRKNLIRTMTLALLSKGSNIAIIGNRGIGKSSLAHQLKEIASGNKLILKQPNVNLDNIGKDFNYKVIYYTCSSINNTEDLLSCIIDENFQNLKKELFISSSYSSSTNTGTSSQIATAIESNGLTSFLGKIKGEGKASKNTENGKDQTINYPSYEYGSNYSIFSQICKLFLEKEFASYNDGILFILDEFDQIKDPSGFASYVKSLATDLPQIRFCIVGVAHDIPGLIKDHPSADRLFSSGIIHLPEMTYDELKEIIKNAEATLNDAITFSEEATEKMIKLANGHPYIIHLIGKEAITNAFLNSKVIVDENYITEAVNDIATNKKDPILENKYKNAVGSSKKREIVLKCLARSQDSSGECHTKEVYKLALEYDVDNASQYVGQLASNEYGAVIVKIRGRYYKFKDSLFHAYVLARPNIM